MSVQQNIDDYYLAGVKTYGTKEETKKAKKRARRKGLFGRIGGTALGALTSFALSGGTINPMTLALLTAGGSRLGSAIGSKMAGDLGSDYEWIQDEVDDMEDLLKSQRDADAFKTGLFQGLGQLSRLATAKKSADSLFDLSNTKIGEKVMTPEFLGEERFAKMVTKKGLEDNPFLREEYLEDTLGNTNIKSFDPKMGDTTNQYTLERYGMSSSDFNFDKVASPGSIPGMSDEQMGGFLKQSAVDSLELLGDRPKAGNVPFDSFHDIVADYDQKRRDALEIGRFSRYIEDPTRRAFSYEFGGE